MVRRVFGCLWCLLMVGLVHWGVSAATNVTCQPDGAESRIYPFSSHMILDPATFDLLYSTSKGPVNETWRFSSFVQLSAVVLPSQALDIRGRGQYEEYVSVRVLGYKERQPLVSELVAEGSFRGTVGPGRAVRVRLAAQPGGLPPKLLAYDSSSAYQTYVLEVTHHVRGLYAWHSTRDLSSTGVLTTDSDSAGMIIGLEYSLY